MTRTEKIGHLFDYPYEERDDKVKELWGEEAHMYNMHIWFSKSAPWPEILQTIRKGATASAYVTLTQDDFDVITADDLRNNSDEAAALIGWWKEVFGEHNGCVQLDFQLYDENTIVCRVCTEEGYRGDSDGFGVEPDMWANALFDFEGKVIRPFRPGYQFSKGF